jgi:UTP--glucose-1-phosphate uridylyltransferase
LEKGINVIQLETASGAAIQSFEGAQGINVPRRRFLPVKTTSDLLLVMSNLFTLNRGNLVMNAQRSFPSVPLVKLGTSFIKVNHLLSSYLEFLYRFLCKVKDFLSRFQSIPDCLELDSLTVSGDVTFGKGVSLRVCNQ